MSLIFIVLDENDRQRTTSIDSDKSATSDTEDEQRPDDADVVIKQKRRFHEPFMIKILKLNRPEMKWIIIGCISSIIFGAVTPVGWPRFYHFVAWICATVAIRLVLLDGLQFICRTRHQESQRRNVKIRAADFLHRCGRWLVSIPKQRGLFQEWRSVDHAHA